jgi:hypothetical protein
MEVKSKKITIFKIAQFLGTEIMVFLSMLIPNLPKYPSKITIFLQIKSIPMIRMAFILKPMLIATAVIYPIFNIITSLITLYIQTIKMAFIFIPTLMTIHDPHISNTTTLTITQYILTTKMAFISNPSLTTMKYISNTIKFTIIPYIQTTKAAFILTQKPIIHLSISDIIIFIITLFILTMTMEFFSTIVIMKIDTLIFNTTTYIQILSI